jgi:hypothetical protein
LSASSRAWRVVGSLVRLGRGRAERGGIHSKGDRKPEMMLWSYDTPANHPVSGFPLRDPSRTDATQWRPYLEAMGTLGRDAVPTLPRCRR